MHEILYHLPPAARVLDLGCWVGSYDAAAFPFLTVRVDLKAKGAGPAANFVQADGTRLPFPARAFDAVICNHGLEHFRDLKPALQEIGRVLKKDGALFVSVPDATTLQDRLYRWLFRGGDHVNLFADPRQLESMLAWYAGLPHAGTRVLYCSYFFLNRRNLYGTLPGTFRLALCSWRWELPLAAINGFLRYLDRRFGTRTSVYGWAMYFGEIGEPVDERPWTNVCLRCAQGHPSRWLAEIGAVRHRGWFFDLYDCPACGAANVYSRDEQFGGFTPEAAEIKR